MADIVGLGCHSPFRPVDTWCPLGGKLRGTQRLSGNYWGKEKYFLLCREQALVYSNQEVKLWCLAK